MVYIVHQTNKDKTLKTSIECNQTYRIYINWTEIELNETNTYTVMYWQLVVLFKPC